MTDHLGRSWGIVSHLKSVKDTEEMRKAVEEMQPAVTPLSG
jgi:Zn-dependent oligopeptidase